MPVVRFLASLLAVFCALSCSQGSEPAQQFVRPWAERGDLAPFFQSPTERRAIAVAGEKKQLALGALPAGRLTLHVALEGEGGRARLGIASGTPSSGAGSECVVEGAVAATSWSPCVFEVEASDATTLEFAAEGEGVWQVSSPLLLTKGDPASPPVFVFLLDTLRNDALFTLDTPELGLGGLVSDGIVIEDLWAPTSWTRTSVATLLTGLGPLEHGVADRLHSLPEGVDTLSEVLGQKGYATYGWSTNPNVLPLWGFGQGFDAFTDMATEAGGLGKKQYKLDAAEVLKRVETVVAANAAAPSFYYVHLMDPHGPLKPKSKTVQEVVRERDGASLYPGLEDDDPGEPVRKLHQRYLAEVLEMERTLGAFFDELKERDLYDRSLILLVSDHGQEFRDHGVSNHGHALWEELLSVPALLKLPGNARAGTRVAGVSSMADLLPTVLTALGIESPVGLAGSDLLSPDGPPADRTLVADLRVDRQQMAAVRRGPWKLIVEEGSEERLFHLDRDPGERRNLVTDEVEVAAELRAALERAQAGAEAGWHVRVCPGPSGGAKRYRIDTRGAPIRPLTMDAEDTIAKRADGDFEVRSDLGRIHEMFFRDRKEAAAASRGKLKDAGRYRHHVDEDEIVVRTTGEAPILRAVDSEDLLVAVGAGDPKPRGTELSLDDLGEKARVGLRHVVECPELWFGEEGSAHLRVWYVESASSVDESTVDADVAERLRALGYQW